MFTIPACSVRWSNTPELFRKPSIDAGERSVVSGRSTLWSGGPSGSSSLCDASGSPDCNGPWGGSLRLDHRHLAAHCKSAGSRATETGELKRQSGRLAEGSGLRHAPKDSLARLDELLAV